MGLFENIKGPQIMKESIRAKEQLAAMEELLVSVTLPKLMAALESYIALPCSTDALKPQESLSEAPPKCPKCGSVMLKRTALKGANAGKEFWGLSKFQGGVKFFKVGSDPSCEIFQGGDCPHLEKKSRGTYLLLQPKSILFFAKIIKRKTQFCPTCFLN